MKKLGKEECYYILVNGYFRPSATFPCYSKKELKNQLMLLKKYGYIKEFDEIKILAKEAYYYYEDFNNIE